MDHTTFMRLETFYKVKKGIDVRMKLENLRVKLRPVFPKKNVALFLMKLIQSLLIFSNQ